jgi:hypothetical protein
MCDSCVLGAHQLQHPAGQAGPPSSRADPHILDLSRDGGVVLAPKRRRGNRECHDLILVIESDHEHRARPAGDSGDDRAGIFQRRHVRITVAERGSFGPYLRRAVDVATVTTH